MRDYFDRATRISREAREFPQMKFPIAGPLLKVLILEGLNKSDRNKYGQMVIQAYANDLVDDVERLQTTMETVEGLRSQQIRDEFAPTRAPFVQHSKHSANFGMMSAQSCCTSSPASPRRRQAAI